MITIDSLYHELEEAKATWTALYDLLKQAQYDTSSPRPAIDHVSVDTLHGRILLVFDLILGMRPSSDDEVNALILSACATELQNQITALRGNAQTILSQSQPHYRENTIIRDGNNNFSWQFFTEESNTATIDVAAHFTPLNSAVNQLLGQAGILLPLCKTSGIADLTLRAQTLAEVIRETEALRTEARKLAKAAEQSAGSAAEKDKSVQDFLSRAETALSKLQSLQQETERETSSVNTLVAQIKKTGASADTLEQQITGYQSKFDAFQTQLDARLKLFQEFESKTQTAEQQNKERETEISRLIDKADTMIRGATTSGLSKSLEDTRELYAKRMDTARNGFFISIAFLTVSALPLAAHFLPGLFGSLFPAVSEQAQNSYYGVIGKIFLLLPATWLTVFFTKSFAEYFHLEREYAHKAALAKSVEGFKREAPTYKEEITASVFGEILNNPSKGKSPEPANHPLYEILTKRLTELFVKKEGK
jgi:hypothetical protein